MQGEGGLVVWWFRGLWPRRVVAVGVVVVLQVVVLWLLMQQLTVWTLGRASSNLSEWVVDGGTEAAAESETSDCPGAGGGGQSQDDGLRSGALEERRWAGKERATDPFSLVGRPQTQASVGRSCCRRGLARWR